MKWIPRGTVPVALVALVLVLGGAAPFAHAQEPGATKTAPRIEVLFVLDSTGSMSSEIDQAKRRILEIGAAIASGDPRPDVRFGIVTYRDRGDEYVTRRWPLERDWEKTRAALTTIRADGGGDTPEAVVQALHEGIRDTRWTLTQDVMKLVYLIGDAPPKRYDDDPDIEKDLRWAAQNGIVIQAVGCGGIDHRGRDFFARVARGTEGRYHALTVRAALAPPTADVHVAGAATPRRARPADLATVVKRTARTYSGEMGVSYEGGEGTAVETTPLAATEDAGTLSGLIGEHTRVVRDARSWRLLWAAHTSTAGTAAPLPAIDFGAEHVLVVSVRDGDGDGVAELRVHDIDDGRVVQVQHGRGAPRFAMRRVAAFDGPVHFTDDRTGGER